MRISRNLAATAAIAALLGGGLALAPAAHATTATGYIDGKGTWTDDLKGEGTLSTSSHAKGNAVALWQKILWADGVKESNGTKFDYADIDGKFGSNTKYATKQWQKLMNTEYGAGLTVDGIVGTKTFQAANRWLHRDDDSSTDGSGRYYGDLHSFALKRSSNKYSLWINSSKGWKVAYYNTLSVV
jgi:peptidoglycan hydrolase-like protein with peptidoglycan-binding domain